MKDPAIEVEAELRVQLEIVLALKPLNAEARGRVLHAIKHLLEAEALVPGCVEAITARGKNKKRGRGPEAGETGSTNLAPGSGAAS